MKYEAKYLKLLERVSINLRRYRKEARLTQEQLSELVDFSTRYYQRLESGAQSPNLLTLYKVAKHLKVDVSALLKK